MKQILKLNVPAVSSRLLVPELDVRVYDTAMSYIDDTKIVKMASEKAPIYRLCKDYEVNGLHFSLNIITDDKNVGKVEKFMDNATKKVDSAIIDEAKLKPWHYLQTKYGDKE